MSPDPGDHLLLRFHSNTRLASWMVRHSFRLAAATPLRGNLLSPTHTHHKTFREFFQCVPTLVVGRQKLSAQIIPIRSRHTLVPRTFAMYSLHY